MALFSCVDMHEVKRDLLDVSSQCAIRGLIHSMKWSSELASSLSVKVDIQSCLETLYTKDEVLVKEYDKYCIGKAFFDSKEFLRASHWLKDCESQLCNFLYFYSRYLDIEKKKRDHTVQILDGKSSEKRDWQELIDLRNDLKRKEDNLDSYGYYLYGVVLKSLDLFNEAVDNLECSVQMQPLFWGAWHELSSLCKDRQAVKELKIPKHWMSEFFHSHVEIDLHMNEEALTHYQELSSIGFAESTYVKSQLATALYNLRDFDASVEHFKQLLNSDPYMLEHVDTYSNILFIQDDRAELSYLAHHVCGVDKYRAETCGVIGNYYSLRGEHEKAVLYFKQALRLNPNYIAAWTLLGHEYVELRNTSAAIESYRRATELNSRDYRAWYGLGQTYEILKLVKNSLYYYREAQKLRPNDARLLIALADTYQNIGKSNEAKKCYTRAVRLGDSEGQASLKLAKLQEIAGEMDEAAKLYAMYIDRIQQGVYGSTDDRGRASLFLARYHQQHDRHEEACSFARKAAEFSETKEEAKTLLAEMTKALKSSSAK